jgi:hypothetical protein
MIYLIIFIGYSIIAAVIAHDVRHVLNRCKVERLYSFGKRTVYLREKKTGRLIGCSNNFFTLLIQGGK